MNALKELQTKELVEKLVRFEKGLKEKSEQSEEYEKASKAI